MFSNGFANGKANGKSEDLRLVFPNAHRASYQEIMSALKDMPSTIVEDVIYGVTHGHVPYEGRMYDTTYRGKLQVTMQELDKKFLETMAVEPTESPNFFENNPSYNGEEGKTRAELPELRRREALDGEWSNLRLD